MKKDNSFIVLCDSLKLKDLKNTLYWLSVFKTETIIILPKLDDKNIIKQFKDIGKTYQSKVHSEVSMINKGLKTSTNYWNIILKSGSIVKNTIFNKINYFKEENSVLYGVRPKEIEFHNPLKWMLVNKDIFEKNGEFDINLSDDYSKLEWSCRLSLNNYFLKGISGVNIY